MKSVSSRSLLAAALLLSAAPAAATNGMRMIGFGPVQDSMGGASVAAPLDAATIVTNPSGMSAVGTRVDLAGTWFAPTVKYTATGGASGTEQESDRAASIIPTLGFVYAVNDKLSVGVGAFGVSGMGVDYPADLYGSTTMTSYMNLRVAPAASYRVTDTLAVGVAANLMYATMEYAVAGAATSMNMEPRDAQSAIGFGGTIGVTFQPVKQLAIGLAYETKSFFGDFEWEIPAHTLNTPGGPAPIPGGTETLDFDQPQVITLGASYAPIEALLLAADVEWINWSSTNGKDQPEFTSDTNLTGAMKWNMNWADQVVLKVGAQYAATKELKIRAGYNYGKMPLDADRGFENVAFPAVAEHHVTLGAGYDIGGLTVNVAGVWSPEATIEGSSPTQNLATYETKMSQLAFDLGLAYRF
jgi:long-chain fatty acid transport protein